MPPGSIGEQTMSFIAPNLSFLTLRPSIRETDDALVIKTGFLTALLTLFLKTTRIEISLSERTITFSKRVAYLFSSSQVVPFAEVGYVDYDFDSMGTDWGLTSSWFGRHDQVESFSISVVTHAGDKHFVCAFRGEGSTCSGWTGVLLGGDSMIDLMGTQDSESRKLAEYIAELLETRIGKLMEISTEMATCSACGRSTSPFKSTCLYCGAVVDSE